jgi:putative aldouronate transport system permease protein
MLISPPAGTRPVLSRRDDKRRGWQGAKRSWRAHWQLHLLVLVPIAYFLVFKYWPMTNAVIAFKDYNVIDGVWGSDWAGFDHFERFFENPMFGPILRNTFLLSAYTLLASFPMPILLALALNEVRLRFFKRTVQMVTYAPYFISTVVIVSMVILFLSPRMGLANDFIGLFGMDPVDFLSNPDHFRHIYVWSEIWQTVGYSAVIYMAALAGIDPTLYEAAKVDGANRVQKIWHIDLPGIVPTAVVVLILGVGNVMAIGFEKAFLFQNTLNLSQSEIIATYTYKIGLLSADFSQASAIGLFNSAINLVLLVSVHLIAKRTTGRGLF